MLFLWTYAPSPKAVRITSTYLCPGGIRVFTLIDLQAWLARWPVPCNQHRTTRATAQPSMRWQCKPAGEPSLALGSVTGGTAQTTAPQGLACGAVLRLAVLLGLNEDVSIVRGLGQILANKIGQVGPTTPRIDRSCS